jgi:sugar lactone lactonase YvrE
MRFRTACAFAAGLFLTFACRPGRESSKAQTPPAAPTAAVTVEPPLPVPSATAPVAVKDAGFQTPESVLFDDESDVFLVSNINGPEIQADGNGFISRLDPEGKVLELKWIDGSKPGQRLDAPKGMAFSGQVLYVADIDSVRMFDRKTGKAQGKVTIPGATFLNDLSAAPDGSVYASDSGFGMGKSGLEPNGADAIYRIAGGKAARVVKDKALGLPNGLLADADGVWVVTFGSGELYRLTAAGTKTNVQKLPAGQLDGIIQTADGSLWISSWEGSSVLRGMPGGTFTPVISGVASPADIAFDPKRGRLWIPLFNGNAVEIHSLASIPAPQL